MFIKLTKIAWISNLNTTINSVMLPIMSYVIGQWSIYWNVAHKNEIFLLYVEKTQDLLIYKLHIDIYIN